MNRRTWGRWAIGLLGVPALGPLAACGGSGDDGDASVRLVNASTGYASLDLYLDGTKAVSSVAYGSSSGYVSADAGSHTTAFYPSGTSTAVLSQTRTLAKDAPVTAVTYGPSGSLKAFALTDTEGAPVSGYTKVLVWNVATDAGTVDVYLGGEGDDVANATALAYSVAAGSSDSNGYVRTTAGTYRLRVTSSSDTTQVLLDTTGLQLTSEQVMCLVITSGSSGVLVNALAVVQGGSVTAFTNTMARARLVNALDGSSVSASFNGTTLSSGSTGPTVGSYVNVTAASAAPVITVAGTALGVAVQTLAAGGDYTLLVYGDAASPQFTLIADDNRLPTSTSAVKMRLVNGLTTAATLSLSADYSSIVDNLAQGSASSFVTLAKTSLNDLQVTTGSTALYDDNDGVTLIAQGVYSVFMFGTPTTSGARFVLRKER